MSYVKILHLCVIITIYIQDGLVCVFDLATLQEEDALLAVKNSNASVVRHMAIQFLLSDWY